MIFATILISAGWALGAAVLVNEFVTKSSLAATATFIGVYALSMLSAWLVRRQKNVESKGNEFKRS